MCKVILMTLLAVVSSSAVAEWVTVGSGSGLGENTTTHAIAYADPSTIRKVGNRVEMWVLFDFKTVTAIQGMSVMSTKNKGEFDCKEKQVRTLYTSFFSKHMGSGEVVYKNEIRHNWFLVNQSSPLYDAWEFACKKQ